MKKLWTLSLLACALVACTDTAPNTSASHTEMASPAGMRITGDNQQEIERYNRLKPVAEDMLKTIQSEMAKNDALITHFRKHGASPEIPAHGRRLSALGDEAQKQFGSPMIDPLGQCSKMAGLAELYWSESLTRHDPGPLAVAKRMYEDSIGDCARDISSPPKAIITVEMPQEMKPPHNECLLVIGPEESKVKTMTCPEAVRSLIQAG